MTKEHVLMNEIMLYCGKKDWLCFHCNVGTVQLMDGRFFKTGLPKGYPDLQILTNDGRCLFVETKIHPNKPSLEQIRFQKVLRERGFVCEIVYNLEEFKKIV